MNNKILFVIILFLLSYNIYIGYREVYNQRKVIGELYDDFIDVGLSHTNQYALVIHEAKLGAEFPPLRLYHSSYENNYLADLIQLDTHDSINKHFLEIIKRY